MQSLGVPDIGVGAPYSASIVWTGTAAGAEAFLPGARVVGEMRHPNTNALLLTLDTSVGNLIAQAQTLSVVISEAQTLLLAPALDFQSVKLDFRRYDQLDLDGKPFRIPVMFTWGLQAVVTQR